MVFKRNIRIIVFILFLLSSVYTVSSIYPQFEYSEQSYPSGEVDITGFASSGTQVNLYINDEFVKSKDIIDNGITILLNDSIENYVIPLGASLIFKNNNPERTYTLVIPDYGYKTLSYTQTFTFRSYEEGDVILEDTDDAMTTKISVVDSLVNFTFKDVSDYLDDGTNNIKFVLKHPLSTKINEEEFIYSANYEKYSNTITITNFTNITQSRSILVSGNVDDSLSPLYYVLNVEDKISNLGLLNPIELVGNSFNFTLSGLKEGENIIRFISTESSNQNIFNGEKKLTVTSDTIPPEIEILTSFRKYTNEAHLELNISTDSTLLNYTFNGENYSEEVENNSIVIDLNLEDGKNDLTLIAIDIAGNIAKEAHEIYFNDDEPDILDPQKENLKPESLFFEGTSHFFFEQIEGRTNKPDVSIVIFTFVDGLEDMQGNELTCNSFEKVFLRDLGQLDNSQSYSDSQLNINETQLSLLSLLDKKETVTSDEAGNFDATIILEEKSFDTSDYDSISNAYNSNKNPDVRSVDSRNIICMIMLDKYGNSNTLSYDVTLDAGNTMWRAGEITTIPNNIYAAEVEQTGDVRSGSGNIEFGMIARFKYLGPGKVTNLQSFRINFDNDMAENSGTIDSTRLNWRLDKSTGDMLVYVPVKIKKLNKDPLEYPEKLDFAFAARVTYEVDDNDIPIDEVNPIYFQTSLNVERPLDSAKWLTPAMIEKVQSFLNKTITFTQKATDIMSFVAIGGVLTCTGAKFWHAYEITKLKASEKDEATLAKKQEELDKKLYLICDRVASTASPYTCDNIENRGEMLSPDEYKTGIEYKDTDGKLKGTFKPNIGGACDYPDGDTDKKDGVWVSGEGYSFKEESVSGVLSNVKSEVYFRKQCMPATYKVDTGGEKQLHINFSSVTGKMCYNPDAPDFDSTRCNFFGADNENQYGGGIPGKDPSTSIISSIRCGAITDTYSHLKNYLKIQQGIYDCMEQAKFGTMKGSYCERLMSQAICDIATNVILPEFQSPINPRTGASGEQAERNPFSSFLGEMKANEKAFNDRYSGTFFDKAGLGTDQIINKACVGAITGDWSVLTDNILSAIDQNEVMPVFGPPFPESRQQGYNPITGDLSIRYLFTYGVLSGGQRVDTKIEFICDQDQPNGDYCPDDGIILSSNVDGSTLKTKTMSVPKGGSKQDSVVITDTKARYWYNVLRMTHTFELKGETKTVTQEFPIAHKDESLIADCYFSPGLLGDGSGINCEGIFFSENSLVSAFSIDDDTTLLPSKQKTFFEGNSIYANLIYSAKNYEKFNQDLSLVYMAVCNEGSTSQYIIKNNGDLTPNLDLTEGSTPIIESRSPVELFKELPTISQSTTNNILYTVTPTETNSYYTIKAKLVDSQKTGSYSIDNIAAGSENLVLSSKGAVLTSDKPEVELVASYHSSNDLNEIVLSLTKIANVEFYLERREERGNSDSIAPVVETIPFIKADGNLLSQASCNLYMRVLPSSQVNDITYENFKNYSYATEDSDVQYDSKLSSSAEGLFKTSFKLAKKNTNTKSVVYFDLIRPYASQTLCIEKNSAEIKIPFDFVIQNSLTDFKYPLKFDYKLISSKYGTLKSTQNPLDSPLKSRIYNEEISFALSDSLKNSLETSIDDTLEDKTWAHLFGLESRQTFTFTYTLTETGLNNKETIIAKDDITFYITLKDSCSITTKTTTPETATSSRD